MLKNILKVVFRNTFNNKAFSTINISGLALGMTCFIFIFLWVEDEKSIDSFHEHGENLYNVYQTIHANGKVIGDYSTRLRFTDQKTNIPLEGIEDAIPEVKRVNFYATGYELPWGHPETFQVDDKIYKLEGARADQEFFKMFSYPVIAGGALSSLVDISSIAVSRKMAELFFDSPDAAIGQTVRYEDKFDLKITSVFENVPAQSSMQFDFIINWESHMTRLEWASNRVLTTLQLLRQFFLK